MEHCSIFSYRKNFVCEEHNRKLGITITDYNKLMEKGKISDLEMHILEALKVLLYAPKNQIFKYSTTHGYHSENIFPALQRLCDYGLVRCFSFYSSHDFENTRSCNIYSLTKSAFSIIKTTDLPQILGNKHIPYFIIDNEIAYISVLNRLAFNEFYLNSLVYEGRFYLTYTAGSVSAEGRFVLPSDKYFKEHINLFVIAVRDTADNGYDTACKVRAIQEHCKDKHYKNPWFIFVCEDQAHQMQLFFYLKECAVIKDCIFFMTKDTYLVEDGVDSFDNLVTFKQKDNRILSDFKRLIL